MPVKKSGRTLQREEGLARTDNNLKTHSWPVIQPINQKNYYTEYLKRDDQALVYRQQNAHLKASQEAKERQHVGASNDQDDVVELEHGTGDGVDSIELLGSKVIVIHPGSRNLRIGLASDALPKTIPNVIARRADRSECEEGDDGPRPKRFKMDMDEMDIQEDITEDQVLPQRRTRGALKRASSVEKEATIGDAYEQTFKNMAEQLKARMRQNKRRILPNSRETVLNYNRRSSPEIIKDHNDPYRAEWTDVSGAPEYVVGDAALRIADNSKPRYKLFWPIRDGVFNEHDYTSKRKWLEDVATIFTEVIKQDLNIERKHLKSYWACLVIPDLYDRVYVTEMIEMLLRDFQFAQVCIFQESMATSFGAGFSSACIVDIGAQKTSISCVEEGMILADSRVNLKYGGDDITNALIQMFLHNSFPYADINLRRRYDYLLAEELKTKYATLNEADVVPQSYNFHVRAPGEETRKYQFRTFDEVYLAPETLFQPGILDISDKLRGRRSVWPKSHDIYDDIANDPTSAAQTSLFNIAFGLDEVDPTASETVTAATLSSKPLNPLAHLASLNNGENTPRTSTAGSPAPEANTPRFGTSTPVPGMNGGNVISAASINEAMTIKDEQSIPPIPLDKAIFESIKFAAKGDEKKSKDFFLGILVVGGGSMTTGFYHLLEDRLTQLKPNLTSIIISVPPRELDPQVIVWKGASVFGKLTGTNDTWIKQQEYDILGSRILAYKTMFQW